MKTIHAPWKCPKCGRQFMRQHQPHSCRLYPLQNHFKGKEHLIFMYRELKKALRIETGPFKELSLECCIHFETTGTFAAIKIMKDRIRIEFTHSQKIRSSRFKSLARLASHRYLYYTDIFSAIEIDEVLMGYLREAWMQQNGKQQAA